MSWYPFNKPLSDVNADDVRALIGNVSESEVFELKRMAPDKKGLDRWADGKLSDANKAEIAAEVVALANSQGGTVAIGIDEDDHELQSVQGRRNDLAPAISFDEVPTDSLRPAKRRVRKSDPVQAARIDGSIAEFGTCKPIIVDADHRIIEGHAVWEAAARAGHWLRVCGNRRTAA